MSVQVFGQRPRYRLMALARPTVLFALLISIHAPCAVYGQVIEEQGDGSQTSRETPAADQPSGNGDEQAPPVAGASDAAEPAPSRLQPPTPEPEPVVIPPAPRTPAPEAPKLGFSESEAVSLAEGWRQRYTVPLLGRNGQVIYHFGESVAKIIAAPRNITDVELQLGERIVDNGLFIGDSVNWEVTPVVRITANGAASHLILKPFYPNLETTLSVLTDRRVYYLYLHSTLDRFMSSVAFSYPADTATALREYQFGVAGAQASAAQKQQVRIPAPSGEGQTAVPANALDFNFLLTGDDPDWKPVRIYADTNKTYIQMPRKMRHAEAPVVLELGNRNARQIVNYRLQGDTFVIDKLLTKGVLLAGDGKQQVEVIFTHVAASGTLSAVHHETRPPGEGK